MSNTTSSFTWEFEVTGIYQTDAAETNQQMIFMRHDYLDENRGYGRYYVSWLVAKLSRGANADGVSHAIDKVFENSTAETRTTTEQVFVKEQAQQFVDLSWILKLVVLAVFFTLLLIASNSMSQSIRERMNELAVMKSLGFSSGKLIASVYMEALLIIFVGAASGVLIAAFGLDVVQQKLATFLPGIHIQASHYVQIVVMIFSLALICCVSPALSIYRLTISKALRT
ncbi:hypothetical protein AC626_12050 [Pseudoalteromonas rubra]|uniref:ABC3 transporter permease C-terminal domain-containing protein n=2 Tax=Pseudoalteromonas TaxID=53246 RepID=A0A0L0ETN5_9GAMM|nr:hypothetical protein AC626_12050 [Pseudoalteromonas rubra]